MAASKKKHVVYENEDIIVTVFNGPSRKAGMTLIDRRRWEIAFTQYDRSIELGPIDAAQLTLALGKSLKDKR